MMRCQVVLRRGRFNTASIFQAGFGPGLAIVQTVVTTATSTPAVPLLTGSIQRRLDNVAGFMEIGLLESRSPTVPELIIMSFPENAVSSGTSRHHHHHGSPPLPPSYFPLLHCYYKCKINEVYEKR